MLARLSAFVVWALVAGAIVFWGLRMFVSPTPAPGHAMAAMDATAAGGDLSRLLGAVQAPAADVPPPESTRFKLLGVLAVRDAANRAVPGVALVSVDGKPPRPYRAGARIEDRLVLQSVSHRSAAFGPETGPAAFTLEVPRMPEPATGTLSPVDASQLQVEPAAPPAREPIPTPAPAQAPVVTVNPGESPNNPGGMPAGGPPPDGGSGGPGASGSGRQ